MSDTNPKHTPMTDAEFENQVRWSSAHPDTQKCVAEARRARRSEAALKARCAELEAGLDDIRLRTRDDEEIGRIARALLEADHCAMPTVNTTNDREKNLARLAAQRALKGKR